jgi:hypothetical protein
MMRATDFEVRNQTLLHLLVLAAALLTYSFQRDDIVWAAVKGHAERRLLERIVFGVGTLLIFASAALLTWARASIGRTASSAKSMGQLAFLQRSPYLGRILFALGIGLLAPASGTAILLAGESILVLRLLGRDRESASLPAANKDAARSQDLTPHPPLSKQPGKWRDALRQESSKWGLAITMVLFTLTLRDRLAEILGAASLLLWVTLNLPDFFRSRGSNRSA